MAGEDREIGGEHGGGYFAAVSAVADEGCYEAGGFEWLGRGGVREGVHGFFGGK